MDRGRDKPPKGPGEPRNPKGPANPKASEASKASKASKVSDATAPGSVAVDQRGRNVWHFHGESIDSTSMMLQRLENPELALEPTLKTKRLAAESPGATGKAPAGRNPPGKSPPTARDQPGAKAGQPGATQGEPGPARSPGAARRRDDDTEQSFEQRFSVKPGKSSGGGFDPYNNS